MKNLSVVCGTRRRKAPGVKLSDPNLKQAQRCKCGSLCRPVLPVTEQIYRQLSVREQPFYAFRASFSVPALLASCSDAYDSNELSPSIGVSSSCKIQYFQWPEGS